MHFYVWDSDSKPSNIPDVNYGLGIHKYIGGGTKRGFQIIFRHDGEFYYRVYNTSSWATSEWKQVTKQTAV